MSQTILVVDDEQPIVDAIEYNLRKEGYVVRTAGDAERALAIARSENPDLIILDVMLPSASGFDVCRTVRASSQVPIIMLTARAEETDRVVGLELGADDYVTKPFSMRELMARVRSVLRRTAAQETPAFAAIEVCGMVIDPSRHEVRVGGQTLDLPPREFQLLHFLASNPGRAFTREAILARVWGADSYVGEKTVDVHVRWLREKIEVDASQPQCLVTVRGVGYRLETCP
jgi:phosphate regulon transcriptional regulator PhoB